MRGGFLYSAHVGVILLCIYLILLGQESKILQYDCSKCRKIGASDSLSVCKLATFKAERK